MPAVLRPVLRCVACRTLSSVLLQLRNISFCRFLTLARSPSLAALKIRCRSRRTLSSCRRQSMASHSRTTSSGPFTPRAAIAVSKAKAVIASNLSLGSRGSGRSSSKAHLPTSALLLQPGTRPGIRPVIQDGRVE
jgi:hypothetical protein